MQREFTNYYTNVGRSDREPIYVGDLVVLTIPRKERRKEAVVFKVTKDNEFKIEYYSGPMHPASPHYVQLLTTQVYAVVGNEIDGVNEDLFK